MTDKPRQAPHLLNEPPILVYPTLAEAMGINHSIVFQQLHFLLNGQKTSKNEYNFVDDKWWVYNSYAEWKKDHFRWLSVSSLKGIFRKLEKMGLVLAQQSVKNKSDRRKWYTIDYKAWDKFCLTIGQNLSYEPSDKNYPINGQEMSDGYSETTSETTETRTENKNPAPIGTDPEPEKLPVVTSVVKAAQEHIEKTTALTTKNLYQEAVKATFKAEFGSFNGLLVNFLTASSKNKGKWKEWQIDDPPMQPGEIVGFGDWYATDYKDAYEKNQKKPPKSPETLGPRIMEFRAQPNYQQYVDRAGAAFMARMGIESAPPPEPPKELPPPDPEQLKTYDAIINALANKEPINELISG